MFPLFHVDGLGVGPTDEFVVGGGLLEVDWVLFPLCNGVNVVLGITDAEPAFPV